jgi:hypothetical protein
VSIGWKAESPTVRGLCPVEENLRLMYNYYVNIFKNYFNCDLNTYVYVPDLLWISAWLGTRVVLDAVENGTILSL